MSDIQRYNIDLYEWISSADENNQKHRRAIALILVSFACLDSYQLALKGGIWLNLVCKSPRMSTDIDFTAYFDPELKNQIRQDIDNALQLSCEQFGNPGIDACVHNIIQHNHPIFPGWQIKIAYSVQNPYRSKPSTNYYSIDVSFNEPALYSEAKLVFSEGGQILGYSLIDIIAEKFRALLQLSYRKRERSQDVFDLYFLQERMEFDDKRKEAILTALMEKAKATGKLDNLHSKFLANPDIKKRAKANWNQITLTAGFVPEFETCFETVISFYEGLPWQSESSQIE